MNSVVAKKWVRGIIPDKENREKDDFYPTPPEGTRALLKVESFEGDIWEPACGDGAISRELESAGYNVISTDLVDRDYGQSRIDFLMETKPMAPNIVTNPPFKYMEPFLDRALSLTTGKVAFLGRLALLEGKARMDMWQSTPIARIWVFGPRLTMTRGRQEEQAGNGGMIAFAWYVWEHGYEGRPELGWIKPEGKVT